MRPQILLRLATPTLGLMALGGCASVEVSHAARAEPCLTARSSCQPSVPLLFQVTVRQQPSRVSGAWSTRQFWGRRRGHDRCATASPRPTSQADASAPPVSMVARYVLSPSHSAMAPDERSPRSATGSASRPAWSLAPSRSRPRPRHVRWPVRHHPRRAPRCIHSE
jgi:hypothetical protein